jgi:glucan 1,3-beta-glucosidase
MSFRSENYLNYKSAGIQAGSGPLYQMSESDQREIFMEILNNGVHGFCFSLYEEGQKPGDIISEDQIRRRLLILKPYTTWIRSFSCTEGNEIIPKIARELGMKTLVGAWLGSDKDKNQEELDNLIELARDGYVDIAAVGNEVLYRKDLSEDELLEHITYVKQAIPDVPVGYVDAYYEFVIRTRVTELCDIILCNCYPYWEGTAFDYSFEHMRHMFELAKQAANGKPVLITETGWPSQGEGLGDAKPSHNNALKYFINTQLWSKDDEIGVFYFASFDESWKKDNEGEVGAFWGVWDSKEKLKF